LKNTVLTFQVRLPLLRCYRGQRTHRQLLSEKSQFRLQVFNAGDLVNTAQLVRPEKGKFSFLACCTEALWKI